MTDESRTVPGRYQVASLIMLMLDVLGLLGLLYGTTVVAAKFRQIFADLLESRPLPVLTRLVLSIPASVALLFFVGSMAALIYKEVRMGNKSRALVYQRRRPRSQRDHLGPAGSGTLRAADRHHHVALEVRSDLRLGVSAQSPTRESYQHYVLHPPSPVRQTLVDLRHSQEYFCYV